MSNIQWRTQQLVLTAEPTSNSDVPIIYGRQGDINPVRLHIQVYNSGQLLSGQWYQDKRVYFNAKSTKINIRSGAIYTDGSSVVVTIPGEVFKYSGLVPECYLSIEDTDGQVIISSTSTFRIYVHSGVAVADLKDHYIQEIDSILEGFKKVISNLEDISNTDTVNLMNYLSSWKASLDDLYEIDSESTKYLTQTYTVLNAAVQGILARAIIQDQAGAITYAMLAQDVRTAITGGSTAVVGNNAVSTVNVVDGSMTNEKMSRAAVQVHFIPDGTLRAVDLDSASGILSFGADACIYWKNTYLKIPANHVVDLKVSFTGTAGLLLIDLTAGSVSVQTAGSVIPAGTAILGAIRRNGTKYHFTGAIADSIRIDGVRQGANYGPISPAGFYCGPNGYLSYDPAAKTLTAIRSSVYFYSNEGEFSLPANTVITAEGTVGSVVKLAVNFTTRTAKIINATNYSIGAFVEVARFELSDIGIFDSSSQFIRLYHRSARDGNIEFFPSATGLPYYDPARQRVNWMCAGDQAYVKYNDQVHQLAVGAYTNLPESISSSFMFMLNPTTGQVACKPAYNTFSKENEICIGGGRRGPDKTFHFWGVPIFYIGAEPAVSQPERGLSGGSIAVSHRGYNRTMPEQVADSYLMAKSYGATTWETDIQFTRDGIPVIHHDLTINRIARTAEGLQLTQPVNIADKTLAELNTYDYGIGKNAYFAGTKILTFENWVKLAYTLGVEKLFPELKIRINAAQASVMLNILKKWNMYDKTYWLASDWTNFDILSSVDDNTGFVFLGATDAHMSTMAPYKNGKREVWASPSWGSITDTQAQTLKNNGYKLYIWTVGSESNVNKFKNVAVDSFGYDGGIHIGLTQLAELMRDSI